MWKGDEVGAEIIFWLLYNEAISQAVWPHNWLNRFGQPQNFQQARYLVKTCNYATEEQTSKAIHWLMKYAGAESNPAVVSIRVASITKAFSSEFSKIAIDHFSYHNDTVNFTIKSYDMNSSDKE
ncbi:MAG: hypothetical protein EZS28_017605 [Streblomastix strix]|uniref:Uncharacterized protein n=1 Tax=Streblomastix strix TaxID=222440 RepID=A0A5J4VW58_9EUKA|nr:MAG: hypothetical protein EZS28_017605 [Streblomastix strix]